MIDMDKLLHATLLYDYYGELLTAKQRTVFGMYYNDDLSLAEIADEMRITRQGVRDLIIRAEKTMRKYEKALRLVEKHLERVYKTEAITGIIQGIINENPDDSRLIRSLCKIREELIIQNEV